MSYIAGYCDTRRAQRLTTTIFVVRIILTALIVLATIPVAIFTRESGPTFFGVIFCGAVLALTIYVTFGWLEQTLVLLIGVAFNTAEAHTVKAAAPASGAPARVADPTPKPSHWSEKQERAYQRLMGDSESVE